MISKEEKLKPMFWLPDKTSTGERLSCDNCESFGECEYGRSGWVCGIWKEAKETQMTLFRKDKS